MNLNRVAGRVGHGQHGTLRDAGDADAQDFRLVRQGCRDIQRNRGVFIAGRVVQVQFRRIGHAGHVNGDTPQRRFRHITFVRRRRRDGQVEVAREIDRRQDRQAVQFALAQGHLTVNDFKRFAVARDNRARWNIGQGDRQGFRAIRIQFGHVERERNCGVFDTRGGRVANLRPVGHALNGDVQGDRIGSRRGDLARIRVGFRGRRRDGQLEIVGTVGQRRDGQAFKLRRGQRHAGIGIGRREGLPPRQIQGGADGDTGNRYLRNLAVNILGRGLRIDVQRDGGVFVTERGIDIDRRRIDLGDNGDVERHRIGGRRGDGAGFRIGFLGCGRNLQREVGIEIFRQGNREAFHIGGINRPFARVGVIGAGRQGRPFRHARDGHGDDFTIDVLCRRLGIDVERNRAAVFQTGRRIDGDRRCVGNGADRNTQGNRRTGGFGDLASIRVRFLRRRRDGEREVRIEVFRQGNRQAFDLGRRQVDGRVALCRREGEAARQIQGRTDGNVGHGEAGDLAVDVFGRRGTADG